MTPSFRHFSFLGVLFLVLLSFPVTGHAVSRIQKGVYIQGINVGGMTRSQAMDAIDAYFQGIADSTFSIICMDGETESVAVSDWGFEWDTWTAVRQALRLGNENSLIRRYKSQMNLQYGNIYLDVPYSFSRDEALKTLTYQISEHDAPAVNASITRQQGTFVVSGTAKEGIITNKQATLLRIEEQFAEHLGENMSVKTISQKDLPKVTAEDLSVIKDELGTFTTSYGDSAAGRKANIKVATDFLDSLIVMPGESLSVSDAIRPRTEEYGYQMAAQYSNGESEQDIGGGICQVSTTLYNTLLRAELQIDERHPHSMVVSYVAYGDDAAIADGTKDLIFTNNLDAPIYIQGIADGDFLTFTIYGVETRPANRRLEFVAETTFLEWPTSKKVRYSDKLAQGRTEISGTVRPEVTATLTKVVYEGEEEIERTLLHTDYYAASRQTITYGTGN